MNNSNAGGAAQLITSSVTQRTPLAAATAFADGASMAATDYANALARGPRGLLSASAVYIHLPFCPSRCLSCDHNTVVSHDPATIDSYLDGLERELDLVADRTGSRRKIGQLHVGGGTPNYLSERQLLRLAMLIDAHFDRMPETAFSVEANPARATPGQLELLNGLGFSEIHFELRDLDQRVQRSIGRAHSHAMLQDVFSNARDAGFRTVGMDLLYGLPGQTVSGMRNSVVEALALQPDRVSCHAYTRRAEVFPHQRAIDPDELPSLGDKLALFNAIASGFEEAGLVWVGLDAFVRKGDALAVAQAEGRLRRNWIGYTTQESQELLGFGIGAISEVEGLCVQNHLDIPQWREALLGGALPVRGAVRLDAQQQRQREAMMRLMCNMTLVDQSPLEEMGDGPGSLAEFERNGLLRVGADGVSITPQGRVVLHHIWSDPSPGQRWDNLRRMTGTA